MLKRLKAASDERHCKYSVDSLGSADYETEIMAHICRLYSLLHWQGTLHGYWLSSRTGSCACV